MIEVHCLLCVGRGQGWTLALHPPGSLEKEEQKAAHILSAPWAKWLLLPQLSFLVFQDENQTCMGCQKADTREYIPRPFLSSGRGSDFLEKSSIELWGRVYGPTSVNPPGLQRVLELEERTYLSRQAGDSSFCQSRSWVSSSCTDAPSKQTQAPLAGLHFLGVKIG